jgi:hypothetical protein
MSKTDDKAVSRDLSPQLVSIMTTEHYNLQSGRASTISETSSRANLFLGTVSTTLVALAFIGQISRLGVAFFVFSLILLPSLFFLGLVTFERTLQSSIADTIYARGINRIRHLYLEVAPEMRRYFILSDHDDVPGMMVNEGMRPSRWQLLLSTPGMVAIINSIIGATTLGLLLYVLGVFWLQALLPFSLPLCVGGGIVFLLGSVSWHQRYQSQQRGLAAQALPPAFPSQAQS